MAGGLLPLLCHIALADATTAPGTTTPPPAATAPAPTTPPAPPSSTPAASMADAYQLGYDLYLPIAQMQYFDQQVLSLDGASDAQNQPKIVILDQLAGQLRNTEQLSMKQTADLMRKIGVPQSLRAPYEQAAAALAQPLPMAKDDKGKDGKKLDPASLRILSTMEEADQLIPRDTSMFTVWLNVARGSDADWGFHVGTLDASLTVASVNNEPAIALLSTAPALATKAPASAPTGAKDAMVTLVHEIQVNQDVSQAMLTDAATALHKAFEGD